jgi:hypothetical protein
MYDRKMIWHAHTGEPNMPCTAKDTLYAARIGCGLSIRAKNAATIAWEIIMSSAINISGTKNL